jgi:phosphoglycolate phosphatase-like HAD superfamily hydrolase
MTRLWLLDFDGTLVDSQQAIKACYLKAGQEFVPNRCVFIEKMVIGPTLDETSRMILTDKNLHLLDAFKKKFQELYDDRLILETPQYPKVNETLMQLQSKGDHLCVITNKRSFPTHKLIRHYKWGHLFYWVACMDNYHEAHSKAEVLYEKNICNSIYSKIFFVGDTLDDGISANKMNIPFIKADYGYGSSQDWSEVDIFKKIENFSEILEI